MLVTNSTLADWGNTPPPVEAEALIERVRREDGWDATFVDSLIPIVTISRDGEDVANVHLRVNSWQAHKVGYADEADVEFAQAMASEIAGKAAQLTRGVKGPTLATWGSDPVPQEAGSLIERVEKEAGWDAEFINSLLPIVTIRKDGEEVANVHLSADSAWRTFASDDAAQHDFVQANAMVGQVAHHYGMRAVQG